MKYLTLVHFRFKLQYFSFEYGAYSIISDDKSVVDQALKKISSKNRMKRISAAQVNISAWHGYRDFCRGLCDKIGIETQKICVSAKQRLPSSWKAIEKEFRFISGSEAQIEVLSWPNSERVAIAAVKLAMDSPYEIIDFNSGDTIKGLSNAKLASVRRIKGNANTAISLPNNVAVFKPLIEFPKLREQEFFEEAKGIRQFRLNDDRQIFVSNYRPKNVVVVSKRPMFKNQNENPKELLSFTLNSQGDAQLDYKIDGINEPLVSNRKYFINKSRAITLGFLHVELPYQFSGAIRMEIWTEPLSKLIKNYRCSQINFRPKPANIQMLL